MTDLVTEPRPGAVCLVDDDDSFRESASWWLESLGYDVTSYDRPSACLDGLAAGEPACFLLDVRMPEMSGLELLDTLKARGVTRPVIFMTGHGDVPLAVQAMRKGAVTFLEKPFREDALEEALNIALGAGPAAAGDDNPLAAEHQARVARLTERERQVYDLVVAGDVNKVIAYKLGISPKTVELHRSRVMAKMEASSSTQLVRMAVRGEVDAR